jgi:ribosome maturation factor RimP
MIDTAKIRAIAESKLVDTDLFVVDVTCTGDNVVELTIDSDGSVSIDDCIELSRAVEAEFDRDEEDFELTVASAGIGNPLKTPRQYMKLIGRPVEVVLKNGVKVVAELRAFNDDGITLAYSRMVAVEGKKRKEEAEVVQTYPLNEVKTTKEFLDFK